MSVDLVGQRSKTAALQPRRGEPLLRRLRQVHALNYAILVPGALLMIFPFVWMVATSFKPAPETITFPPTFWPKNPTLANYIDVFERANMARLFRNTAFVATIETILMIYTSALLGYIFAKFRFWGRDLFFYAILSTMFIPFEVYMIPLYVMLTGWGLGNTYTAIILPSIYSAYAMFLFRQFMFSIPGDLIDAARIDGAGEFYIFHRIVVPLSRSVLATLISFYFMWNWNDFLWPLIVLTDSEKYVLPVGLATFVAENFSQYGLLMAGATIAIIPVLIIFIAVQRYIIQGITMTGLK